MNKWNCAPRHVLFVRVARRFAAGSAASVPRSGLYLASEGSAGTGTAGGGSGFGAATAGGEATAGGTGCAARGTTRVRRTGTEALVGRVTVGTTGARGTSGGVDGAGCAAGTGSGCAGSALAASLAVGSLGDADEELIGVVSGSGRAFVRASSRRALSTYAPASRATATPATQSQAGTTRGD
jgi:hypothetical protein